MRTARLSIPNDGTPTEVVFADRDSYGQTMGLYNLSAEDLAVCGAEGDAGESFRGLLAGSVLFFDLDPNERVFVINEGAGAAAVDAVTFK